MNNSLNRLLYASRTVYVPKRSIRSHKRMDVEIGYTLEKQQSFSWPLFIEKLILKDWDSSSDSMVLVDLKAPGGLRALFVLVSSHSDFTVPNHDQRTQALSSIFRGKKYATVKPA